MDPLTRRVGFLLALLSAMIPPSLAQQIDAVVYFLQQTYYSDATSKQ
jgi:hypothetical protein